MAPGAPWPRFHCGNEKNLPEAVILLQLTTQHGHVGSPSSSSRFSKADLSEPLDLVQVLEDISASSQNAVVKYAEPELDVAALVDHLRADDLGGRPSSAQL